MKAIENNEIFKIYAIYKISDIPVEKFNRVINLILIECAHNMGNEFNDKILDATIDLINENFSWLPLTYIASAIYKGSMGDYGAGRLIPRIIKSWLRETAIEYQRIKDHKEIQARMESSGTPIDLKKYPMGKALNLKIDWLTSEKITEDEWDKIPLKQLAEMIGKGHYPNLNDFGIKEKR